MRDAVAHGDRVVPAAAPRTAGDGAVLVAALAQAVAHLAGQLGRQRSFADARRVRLDHAEHASDRARRNAEAGADAADRRVRRGDVRIGAVIDVEQRALRAFEQDRLAVAHRLRQQQRDVAHHRPHPLAVRQQLRQHRLPVHRAVLDEAVARVDVVADVLLEPLRIGEVADADAAARDLVLVGRADAARRRADLALAAARLGQQIEVAVIRQDEVRLVADEDAVGDVDAVLGQLVDLGEQRLRIDDDAVADDADDARDAGCRTESAAGRTSCR